MAGPHVRREPPSPARRGARVILVDGHLVGYLARHGQHLLTFLREEDAECDEHRRALVAALVREAQRDPLLIGKIDGEAAPQSSLATLLKQAGFIPLSRGLLHRGLPRS